MEAGALWVPEGIVLKSFHNQKEKVILQYVKDYFIPFSGITHAELVIRVSQNGPHLTDPKDIGGGGGGRKETIWDPIHPDSFGIP